jgi:hypothetical protein
MPLSPSEEPVSLTSLITAAMASTVSLLLFLGVDPDVVGGINLAVAGWIVVIARVVRARVTPVS